MSVVDQERRHFSLGGGSFIQSTTKPRTLELVKRSVEENTIISLRFCFIMDLLNGDESENERNEEFASESESET